MSEITKACPYEHIMDHDEHCPFCHGTCRTVDVEATLRAEVARLTEENTKLAAERNACTPVDDALDQVDNAIAMLAALVYEHGKYGYQEAVAREGKAAAGAIRAEVARLTATLAERDGEVARLAGSVVWQRGRIPTPDLGPYDDRDEDAERERYLVVFNDDCLDIGPLADLRAERQLPDVVAWARVEIPDSAWLAGCKS